MIDLHVHSNRSDGTFTPTELVDYAIKKGLSAFALTDHDTVEGLEEAIAYAQKLRVDAHNLVPSSSNPSDDWSVPNIAEKLNISVSHFQRLYKKRFGVSCTNDVFISRMQYAKQLILQTDYPVKEIAYMCGYQNYEYFSRSFVKYACISPAQYREKFKEI